MIPNDGQWLPVEIWTVITDPNPVAYRCSDNRYSDTRYSDN